MCCCIVFCSNAWCCFLCTVCVTHKSIALSRSLTHSLSPLVYLSWCRMRAPTRWHTAGCYGCCCCCCCSGAHTTHVQKFVKYTVLLLVLLSQRLYLFSLPLSLTLALIHSSRYVYDTIRYETISHFVDDHRIQRSRKVFCLRVCVFVFYISVWIYISNTFFYTDM